MRMDKTESKIINRTPFRPNKSIEKWEGDELKQRISGCVSIAQNNRLYHEFVANGTWCSLNEDGKSKKFTVDIDQHSFAWAWNETNRSETPSEHGFLAKT